MHRRLVELLLCQILLIGNVAGCATTKPPPESVAPRSRFTALAIDADGNIVSASSTASGAFLEKWSPDGRLLYTADLETHHFCTVTAIVIDQEFIYCALSHDQRPSLPIRVEISRFSLVDGGFAPFTGHSESILKGRVQPYPQLQVPLLRSPIRGMDVAGSTLYVADAFDGRIRMIDTSTGLSKGEFSVHLPHGVAVDPIGQIWVASNHDTITACRADGYSGVTYGGFGEITSMAFGPGATLYVSDSLAGQVMMLDGNANPPKFVPFLGSKAKAVDGEGDHFFNLLAVVVDGKGNLVTLDGGGDSGTSRLVKWSPEKKLLWERVPSTARSTGRN